MERGKGQGRAGGLGVPSRLQLKLLQKERRMKRRVRTEVEGWCNLEDYCAQKKTGKEEGGRAMRKQSPSLLQIKLKVRLLENFQIQESADSELKRCSGKSSSGNFRHRGDSNIF